MAAAVLNARSTEAVAVESGHRGSAAALKLAAEDIFRLGHMPVAVSVRIGHNFGNILIAMGVLRPISSTRFLISGRRRDHLQNFGKMRHRYFAGIPKLLSIKSL